MDQYRHVWPIDPKAGSLPENWKGWPENKKFALVLSHDVDTQKGHDSCRKLMDLESSLGFKSSFNLVPERYRVEKNLIAEMKQRGFEVCVHGLHHDGKLFFSRQLFEDRAEKINKYIEEWGAIGFTSPSMHHNLDWMHALKIKHATSTFDTDPFEPQPDAAGTIFPFWVQNSSPKKGYVELPYTLPQDFTLYTLMKETSINIWKQKLEWIAARGGMALFNTHPDYMNFSSQKETIEEYPATYYVEFIEYIKNAYKGEFWHAQPREMAAFWRQNMLP